MTTFNVSNLGFNYIINNLSNPSITLIRGLTYTFSVNAQGHPFWIQTTTAPYNSSNVYNSGITNNGAQVGNIVFTVPSNAPNTLYYVCQYHSSMNGVINITDAVEPIVCYAKGTLILTSQGYVPIEYIKKGNKIVTKGEIKNNKNINPTANTKKKDVLWISSFKVKTLNSESRPICIKKDTFGENYPFVDLYVSPNHGLFIDDNMFSSKDLVNGTTINQDMECDEVEYYHIECETHSAIFANGILAESYLDTNNRGVFKDNKKCLPVNTFTMVYT